MTNETVHGGEGSDTACFIEHGVPGVLSGIEDILIGQEHTIAEEVVFEILRGFFGGIALWDVGRDIDQGDIAGNAQLLRTVTAGAIGDHGGVDLGLVSMRVATRRSALLRSASLRVALMRFVQ